MAVSQPTERHVRSQFTCARCSAAFSAPPSQKRKFCSYSCCVSHRRETGAWPRSAPALHMTCEVCEGSFEVPPSRKGARFCSQACMLKWRAPVLSANRYRPETHTTAVCRWCSEGFATRWCKIRAGRGRFCSRQCRAAYSANMCQNRVSGAEIRFGAALAAVGLNPLSQHRIGRWTVDFYFPSHGLAVEFDGEYWHSLPRMIEKDARKTAALQGSGVRLLRVPERLWLDDPGGAVQLVSDAIQNIETELNSA